MAQFIPRIALFQGEEQLHQDICNLLTTAEYSVRIVQSIHELNELTIEEGATFDCVLVPLVCSNGKNGKAIVSEMKSDVSLRTIPLLGFALGSETHIVDSFAGAGVDVVYEELPKPEVIFRQILSLTRLKRSYDAHFREHFHESGLAHPMSQAFESVREGILLTDTRYQVHYANHSARHMIGIRSDEDLIHCSKQIERFVKDHDLNERLKESALSEKTVLTDVPFARVDGQRFRIQLDIMSLVRKGESPVGFALALTDLSDIGHISHLLELSHKTRTLCLQGISSAVFLLRSAGQKEIDLLPQISGITKYEPNHCALNSALTMIVELIDQLIAPTMTIKVRTSDTPILRIRSAEFLQIFGELFLHAVEYTGGAGETLIEAESANSICAITIKAESRRVTPFYMSDILTRTLHRGQNNLSPEQTPTGLKNAQRIAKRYGGRVLMQAPDPGLIKLRIELPVVESTQE